MGSFLMGFHVCKYWSLLGKRKGKKDFIMISRGFDVEGHRTWLGVTIPLMLQNQNTLFNYIFLKDLCHKSL